MFKLITAAASAAVLAISAATSPAIAGQERLKFNSANGKEVASAIASSTYDFAEKYWQLKQEQERAEAERIRLDAEAMLTAVMTAYQEAMLDIYQQNLKSSEPYKLSIVARNATQQASIDDLQFVHALVCNIKQANPNLSGVNQVRTIAANSDVKNIITRSMVDSRYSAGNWSTENLRTYDHDFAVMAAAAHNTASCR